MGTQTKPFRFVSGAIALAVAATLTAGCAMGPSPTYVPSSDRPEDRGLEVRLPAPFSLDQGPWAVFYLNKPAYVAIFEVRPGVGVHALYPHTTGAAVQQRFHAGMNTVLRPRGSGAFRFASGTRSLAGAQHACRQELYSPVTYRMIVASERPLRLERLHSYVAFRMMPAVRSQFFAFGSPMDTMDDLLHMVLPVGAAARPGGDGRVGAPRDWAVDWVSYWRSDPNCMRLLAMAPFSPVQRFGTGIHTLPRPQPPLQAPDDEEDGPEEADDENGENGSDVAVERPRAPTGDPGKPAPPIRDRDDGLPDRPGRDGADAEGRHAVPDAWRPEQRERLLPERADPRGFDRLRIEEGRRAAALRPDRVRRSGAEPSGVRGARATDRPLQPLMRPPPSARQPSRAGVPSAADRSTPRAQPTRPARVRPPRAPQVRPSASPSRSGSSSNSERRARDSRD